MAEIPDKRAQPAARGVAICEFPLNDGYGVADYLLYVDGKACGATEAKKQGASLITPRHDKRFPRTRAGPDPAVAFATLAQSEERQESDDDDDSADDVDNTVHERLLRVKGASICGPDGACAGQR